MNALQAETSPYLRQHAGNPVHWQPWGPNALQTAAQENKPILLSIGYAACHWCHVMAHESFENPAIAAVMNEFFISVKVDREERPDIDTIYQSALAMLGQQGGWPLTMFCTPSGHPFWGGTYFPPEPRHGQPGFPHLLRQVARLYQDQSDQVAQNVAAIRDALTRLSTPPPATNDAPPPHRGSVAATLTDAFDPDYGGLGGAPKFPQPSILALLWDASATTANSPRAAAIKTLDHMAQGGIYDHLAGGFARYAVDRAWLVPHFEKMLYDNAQLLELYTLAWQGTGDPIYTERVEQTIDWLLSDMLCQPAAAFVSSFDADSEGEEGKFYVWQAAEIDTLLGADAALFNTHYDVTSAGNWEGKNILNRSAKPQRADPATEAALAKSRRILRQHRATRAPPTRDDKVLADWNGLTIAALANAAFALDRPDWLTAARQAYDFICTQMQPDGHLLHSWCNGTAKHTALLEDYANMARAALILYEQIPDQALLDQAERWVAIANADYADGAGGYFLTAIQADDVIVRPKSATDNATPPGNATMVEVLSRLYKITGTTIHATKAEDILKTFAGAMQAQPTGHTALFNAREYHHNATQITLVGDPTHADTQALRDALRRVAIPARILTQYHPGQPLPPHHPAWSKTQHGTRPTAYVCRGRTCSPPLTDPAALTANLLDTGPTPA